LTTTSNSFLPPNIFHCLPTFNLSLLAFTSFGQPLSFPHFCHFLPTRGSYRRPLLHPIFFHFRASRNNSRQSLSNPHFFHFHDSPSLPLICSLSWPFKVAYDIPFPSPISANFKHLVVDHGNRSLPPIFPILWKFTTTLISPSLPPILPSPTPYCSMYGICRITDTYGTILLVALTLDCRHRIFYGSYYKSLSNPTTMHCLAP
jgi:hypothetical protein